MDRQGRPRAPGAAGRKGRHRRSSTTGTPLHVYDAATNTLYRYTPRRTSEAAEGARPARSSGATTTKSRRVAKIEEAIAHLQQHATVSGATPTDVAGQPAYTVRVSPKEGGSLLGGAELSFDADNGVPLRAAVYSSTSSSPVIELAASEISYGPVADSVFAFTPPPDAKIEEVTLLRTPRRAASSDAPQRADKPEAHHPRPRRHAIAVLESKSQAGAGQSAANRSKGCRRSTINGASASELRTELGTLLSFERSGVRYVLAGSVTPAAIEALARGL